MENISKYLTITDGTKSRTAAKLGILNVPNDEQKKAMANVATNIYDVVKDKFPHAFISSFFRCKTLNHFVGGRDNSQHVLGEAIDIDSTVDNKAIFEFIKDNIEFDQLIWEYGNSESPSWVHVSLKLNGKNRKQIIKIV